jgi:hypothetical protein
MWCLLFLVVSYVTGIDEQPPCEKLFINMTFIDNRINECVGDYLQTHKSEMNSVQTTEAKVRAKLGIALIQVLDFCSELEMKTKDTPNCEDPDLVADYTLMRSFLKRCQAAHVNKDEIEVQRRNDMEINIVQNMHTALSDIERFWNRLGCKY